MSKLNNPIQKHKHCLKHVLHCVTGPHKGRMECIDANCKYKNKFVKWANKQEIDQYSHKSNDVINLIKTTAEGPSYELLDFVEPERARQSSRLADMLKDTI